MLAAASAGTGSYWWEQLPEDFHRQADGTELDAVYPLLVHGTAAADRLLRTALGGVMTLSMTPHLMRRSDMRKELEQLRYYHAFAEAGDVTQSFVAPPQVRV